MYIWKYVFEMRLIVFFIIIILKNKYIKLNVEMFIFNLIYCWYVVVWLVVYYVRFVCFCFGGNGESIWVKFVYCISFCL